MPEHCGVGAHNTSPTGTGAEDVPAGGGEELGRRAVWDFLAIVFPD